MSLLLAVNASSRGAATMTSISASLYYPLVRRREAFQIDEGHNLARALDHFALVLQGYQPDNSERSVRICEARDALRHGERR